MKINSIFLILFLIIGVTQAQELRTFSNVAGKTLEDQLIRYNYEEQIATLAKSGNIPLSTFSQADQDYILHWNMIEGFLKSMRFRIKIEKSNWARMKAEKTITPYWMDAVQVPSKKVPIHRLVMFDDYEEYTAVQLKAEGYTIKLRNQNIFPIENLIVESKVYFEQENYVVPDNLLKSMENGYTSVVVTNKVKYKSETISSIIANEEINLFSASSIIIDQQVDRVLLAEEVEQEDEDVEDEEETAEVQVEILGETVGDVEDHGRRRRGTLIGIWLRVGIKGSEDGEIIWRELTEPSSLQKRVVWE